MKNALLVIGIILVALSIMAPGPPDKAEKLKHDDNGWDITPFFDDETLDYGATLDGILCKYGMATAGEHANFTIAVKFSGVSVTFNDEGKYIWDNTWSETVPAEFVKLQGAEKGADGYILLDTISVSWNGDDDGSGYFVQEVDLGLIAPGDNTMSTVPTIFYNEPGGAVPIIGDNFTGCGVVDSEFPCP